MENQITLTPIAYVKNSRSRIRLTTSEKMSVDKALQSMKVGKVFSHEKVMADMKKRYPSLF